MEWRRTCARDDGAERNGFAKRFKATALPNEKEKNKEKALYNTSQG
jgi:hypothetical protein